MKAFFRENLVLIAGIALPLMLAIGFLGANKMAAMGVEPPKTPVLYYYKNYGSADIEVRDGKVFYVEKKPMPVTDDYYRGMHFYLFNPVSKEVKQIKINKAPDYAAFRDGVLVDDLKDATVSTSEESPDGFIFRNGWNNYNRGFVFDVFGGGRNNMGLHLQNGGLKVRIPDKANAYQGHPVFVGWVIDDAE